MQEGCTVHVMGRNPDRVRALQRDSGCEADGSGSLSGYDAVINCTPVGMKDDSGYMADPSGLLPSATVMDMVYNRRTLLVRTAERKGCAVAKGSDMLVGQGAESFRLWFGREPDRAVMEARL